MMERQYTWDAHKNGKTCRRVAIASVNVPLPHEETQQILKSANQSSKGPLNTVSVYCLKSGTTPCNFLGKIKEEVLSNLKVEEDKALSFMKKLPVRHNLRVQSAPTLNRILLQNENINISHDGHAWWLHWCVSDILLNKLRGIWHIWLLAWEQLKL